MCVVVGSDLVVFPRLVLERTFAYQIDRPTR